MRGDGRPRADVDEADEGSQSVNPLRDYLRTFLSADEYRKISHAHHPDTLLAALEVGTEADASQPWTWARLNIYVSQKSGPSDTEAKIRRIRTVAPVATHNARRYAERHPTAYIAAQIRDKQGEAATHGSSARITPEKLALALKHNDADWSVAKHLAPIAARQRAFVERIHSGEADRQQREAKAREVAEQIERNKRGRADYEKAIEALSAEQMADVWAMVRQPLGFKDRARFDRTSETLRGAEYREAVIQAARKVRSGERFTVPAPPNP